MTFFDRHATPEVQVDVHHAQLDALLRIEPNSIKS